jgi:ribosomal protein S18 acetylase RimI-like enzyme
MIVIRAATSGDIENFKNVIRTSILCLCKDHYTSEEISSLLKQYPENELYECWIKDRVLMVAENKNSIVGFSQYNPGMASIEAIHVLPGYAGRGIGRQLITKIEEIAITQATKKIILDSSLNAVRFYQQCGYKRMGDSNYICSDGVKLDVVKFEKMIGS